MPPSQRWSRIRVQDQGPWERAGTDPEDLHRVAAATLSRAGYNLDDARGPSVGNAATFRRDPADPAFTKMLDGTMLSTICPFVPASAASASETGGVMHSIAFKPPMMDDDHDAGDVGRVNLEHRLGRRLLSRFLSQGFNQSYPAYPSSMGPERNRAPC